MPRSLALLVDYGGVLTTSESESLLAFCAEASVDPEHLRTLIWASHPEGMVAELERGRITLEEFERWLARALSIERGIPVEPEGLAGRLFARVRPDRRMLDAVRRVRSAGIKTGIVSNSWDGGQEQRLLAGSFDAVVLSQEARLRKPEGGIYLQASERIGVEAGACVFVDDLEENVVGAREAGMIGFRHSVADLTVPRLEVAFGVRLS